MTSNLSMTIEVDWVKKGGETIKTVKDIIKMDYLATRCQHVTKTADRTPSTV